jgi:hypothetical protein
MYLDRLLLHSIMRKIPCISFVAVYILLFAVSVNAQLKTPPVIEWQRSLGGINYDYAHSIQQTTDGGYIVAGGSLSTDGDVSGYHGLYDYWIVKLTNNGTTDWQKCLGGTEMDFAYSIQQTTDGGYIVAGYSKSIDSDLSYNHGNSDYWIVKLSSTGAIEWQQTLGGSGDDVAYSIEQTTDGGYIVVGYSFSTDGDVTTHNGGNQERDAWIVKLTSTSTIEWEKSVNVSDDDVAYSIQQTTDGGYIICGSTRQSDYWVVKLNANGEIGWQKLFGGSSYDYAKSIIATRDSGYIVLGHTYSTDGGVTGNHGYYDIWIIKLSADGVIDWEKCIGGSEKEEAYFIRQTTDNGYILAGSSSSVDGDVTGNHLSTDYWIVKLTSIGDISWQKCLGGSDDDQAYSIEQTTDGGYIVAGYSTSFDGDLTGIHGANDYWIVKLSPEGTSSIDDERVNNHTLSITPNPATSSATLTLESNEEGICEVQIISVTGATLKQYSTRLTIGKQEIALTDLESLPSGMYEVLVKRGGYLVGQTKLIIE